jgi:hypothetical protein
VTEARLVKSSAASRADLVVIGVILSIAGWVLVSGFATARADFGHLREGKKKYGEALTGRLRLRAKDLFRKGDYEDAARMREAAAMISREESDKKAAAEIRKVPQLEQRITADLEQGRYCPRAREIFAEVSRSEYQTLRDRVTGLFAGKAEKFMADLAELQTQAHAKEWRICQGIINDLDRRGYRLASQGGFLKELIGRINNPKDPKPTPDWVGTSISSLAKNDGGVIPHEYVRGFAPVSELARKYFETSRNGVYSSDGFQTEMGEIDAGDDIFDSPDWWRYFSVNGLQPLFGAGDRQLELVTDSPVTAAKEDDDQADDDDDDAEDRDEDVADGDAEEDGAEDADGDATTRVLPLPDRTLISGEKLVVLLDRKPHLAGRYIVDNPEGSNPKSGTPENPRSGDVYHEVMLGETMSEIARLYHTQEDLIARHTGSKEVRAGQLLYVPMIQAASDSAEMTETKAGDMLPPIPEATVKRGGSVSVEELLQNRCEEMERQIRSLEKELQESRNRATAGKPAPPKAPAIARASSRPAPAPAPLGAEGNAVPNAPRIRSVEINEPIEFSAFAAAHGTSTAKLNALNGHNLNPSTILAKGSVFYVPAQP